MTREELVHEDERDGFSVRLYFGPEDMDPHDSFDDWFYAHVTVSAQPGGPVLGDDYLGGCCYKSVADFIQPGGYYDDMVRAAIDQAQDRARQAAMQRCFC